MRRTLSTNRDTATNRQRPGFVLQRSCACVAQTKEGGCEACREERNTLQRSGIGGAADIPPVVYDALRAPGHALDSMTRAQMESQFGHDFSRVRVHTDNTAAESARSLNALAYTVGSDVVFGSGLYHPASIEGRRLLAHELTHVVQQASGLRASSSISSIDPHPHAEAQARRAGESAEHQASEAPSRIGRSVLQRAPAGGGKKAATPHITQIVVDQNVKQTVTATFSDGSVTSDECSTGKGHCCFDDTAGAAEGGACSAALSTQTDNNCTPIGDFVVTAKIPKTSGGIEHWTQFHNAKQVALHEYWPVNGTPLSHGCVRLHSATAKTIYDGSRVGRTKVKVQGLAKPNCKDSTLQAEWSGDFTQAGKKPPDGTMINPATTKKYTGKEIARERHYIEEARSELKSALGVDEKGLDAQIASLGAGATVVSKIPRCVPALTVEEKEVSSAKGGGFLTPDAEKTSIAFSKALSGVKSSKAAEAVVKKFGEQLWQTATASARKGGAGTDDRQIYWTRLMLATTLRQWSPKWITDADILRRLIAKLLQLFEQTSRGMTSATFPDDPDLKHILISGFDPFGFPNQGDIRQSNLSGAAALALDGETIAVGTTSAHVESAVFPVRYADFNEGIVENYLRPKLTAANPPNLVMSISQGGAQFELEEFAGRRRSVDTFADNLGRMGGGTPTKPEVPPGLASGPEFIQETVPAPMLGAMRGVLGRKKPIKEETEVSDLPTGATQPRDLPKGPGSTKASRKAPGVAVTGSGGGFLSNEIFYRNSLLQASSSKKIPMIHLHTPMLPPDATDAARNTLVGTVRKILRAAVPHL
jgi:pyrrolidone-carboxylate peptidase